MPAELALTLLVLAGCAAAEATTIGPPAPATKAPAAGEIGLNPGETMAFEVRLAGLVAGEAQLAVGDLGDFQGHRVVVVKSHAETAGAAAMFKHIVDEATTVIDMDSGLPVSAETVVEEGATKTTGTFKFAPGAVDVSYIKSDEQHPHSLRVTSRDVALHDAHSAMAALRGWRAAPGSMRTVYVIGGRRMWRVDVKMVGEDTVGAKIGNRPAVVFSGAAYRINRSLQPETPKPTRTFSVWLSNDADRVPLKLTAATELGEVAMDLVEYNR